MPFPDFFPRLLQSRQFWRDFFWLTDGEPRSSRHESPYPQLADFKLRLPVCDGYGLSLSFDSHLVSSSLDFIAPQADPVNIAWDDQAHWHPHVMRWHELETICRAIAGADPESSHPGWVVLLLQRFAPICLGDDVEAITATLEAAWKRVGKFSDNEITAFIERMDARDAEFRWRYDNSCGWVIEQEDRSGAWKGLYTTRSVGNDDFPFAAWQRMIDKASSRLLRLTNVERKAAERFATSGSTDEIPDIVAALRSAGHDSPAKSLEASGSTAQACWICEAILGQPFGAIGRKHLSHECLPRKQHHLSLCLPFDDQRRPLPTQYAKFFRDTLDCILQSICDGSAESSGGSGRNDERGNYVAINSNYSIHLTGSLQQGMDLIRGLLWWGKAPLSVRIADSTGDEISLHLETGTTKSDHLVLELAKPTVFRWKFGYRIDRAALSPACQSAILEVLDGCDAEGPDDDGWFTAKTLDHGSIDLCANQLGVSETLLGVTIVIDTITAGTSSLLYQLMQAGELILLPLLVATDEVAAKPLSADWPNVEIVESDAMLHSILSAGAFHWWSQP